MKQTLRPYQEQFINEIYDAAESNSRILGVKACGLGKLTIAAHLINDHIQEGLRAYFVCSLDVLVDQARDRLVGAGIDPEQIGYIKAGHPERRTALVQIASIQTMGRRKWWRDYVPVLAVWDEAHILWNHRLTKELLAEWQQTLNLGLTATPWRLSRKNSMVFQTQALVTGPTTREAQEMGFLAHADYYSLADAQADLEGIRIVAGDYDQHALEARTDRTELIERMVANWFKYAEGKRTAVFTVSVAHTQHVAEVFNAHGVPAAGIDGKTPLQERRRLYREFREGKVLVLVSCGVLSVGFDEPSMECAILARPTKSVSLLHQQIGRALRISPDTGKTRALVLDMAGVLSSLPVPEALSHYELQAPPDASATRDGASMKRCPTAPACPCMSFGFAKVCSRCGAEFPTNKVDHDGSLSRLVLLDNGKAAKEQKRLIRRLHHFRRLAFRHNRDPRWASTSFYMENRTAARPEWHHHAIYTEPQTMNVAGYLTYLETVQRRRGLEADWLAARMAEEFGEFPWREALEELGLASAIQ